MASSAHLVLKLNLNSVPSGQIGKALSAQGPFLTISVPSAQTGEASSAHFVFLENLDPSGQVGFSPSAHEGR